MSTSYKREIATSLLEIEAVKLSPDKPFTWASGWHSPIYCDNRKTLSYPEVRKQIYKSFAKIIAELYPEADIIAGVATGAIAHGVLAAEQMGKPFIYVRSAAKDHGLANQIEGAYKPGDKVVVIEDLVSTGGSSLKAVEALREAAFRGGRMQIRHAQRLRRTHRCGGRTRLRIGQRDGHPQRVAHLARYMEEIIWRSIKANRYA